MTTDIKAADNQGSRKRIWFSEFGEEEEETRDLGSWEVLKVGGF